jgi:hypothetical protein
MNHFTPLRIPYRRRSLAGRVLIVLCVAVSSASLLVAANNISKTWHAASSIGRPVVVGVR